MKKLITALLTVSMLATSTAALAVDNKVVSKNLPVKKATSTIKNGAIKFEVLPNLQSLKPVVKAKLEGISKKRGFFYMSNNGGKGFVFRIAAGQKPNPGYGIKVKSVTYVSGKLQIVVEETLPKPGMMYTQQLTYPTVTFKAALASEVVVVKNTKGEKFKFIMPTATATTTNANTNKTSIVINKVGSKVSSKLFIPEDAYNKDLTLAELTQYFGKNPMPTVPSEFTPVSDKASIIFNADGSILFMSPFTYSKDANDPDSPSISIQLNKGKLPPRDCIYTTTPIDSVIGNTKLTIGLMKETDSLDATSPTEAYDVYTSQFIYNGVGYSISASRIDEKAFVNILKTIIK
jgi:hypothetical protein